MELVWPIVRIVFLAIAITAGSLIAMALVIWLLDLIAERYSTAKR